MIKSEITSLSIAMNSGRLAALICFAFVHLNVNAFQGRISLSPKTWFPRDFRRLQALQSVPRRPKPLAFSDGKGLVAGTSNALAVHAGTEALSKGGNAMDACLTTALTEITLATGSRVSYAGAVNILYYDSISGETHNLDAGWNKPYYIDSAQIPDDQSQVNNGASILVPGFIAGVSMAVEKFSLFPLSKLLGPALHFAQEGFKVPPDLADAIRKYYNPKTLLRTREGKNIFTNPKTQKPYRAGERLRQPKLAKFLKRLAKHGKDYFYRGHWAEEMVETAQTHDGYITMEDMNEYRVTSLPPASTSYQHYQVLTTGTEWGGLELVEMLNLMELAGIGNSTDSYLTNARKFFWLASITRLSSFISLLTEGVPNGRDVLKEHLDLDIANSDRLTKNVAEQLWDRISSPSKMRELNDMMQEMLATNVGELNLKRHERGSSGVVAMDSEGNVCSLVHGTDSQWWGSGLFVQGVSLPSAGIALKSLMKQTKAGGRLPSELRPVIVFQEDFADAATSGRNKREIPVLKKGNTDKMFRNKNAGKKTQKTMHNNSDNSIPPRSLSNESQPTNQSRRFHYHSMPEKDVEIIERGEPNNDPIDDGNSPSKKKGETVRHPNAGKSLTTSKLASSSKESTQAFQKTDRKVSLRGDPRKETKHGSHDFHILGKDELEKDFGLEKNEEEAQDQLLWPDVEHVDLEDIREFPHLGIPESWEPEFDFSELIDEEKFRVGLIPVLALACTGRSHPFVAPQYLTNILDSGMNPKAALEAPTFLAPYPHSYQHDIQVEKYAIDENILMGVDELGQSLREVDYQTAEDEAGIGVAVTFDSRRKMLGCAHPYKEGFAEGVSELRVFRK